MQLAVPPKQKSSNCNSSLLDSFKLLGENIKLYRFEEWMGQEWERMHVVCCIERFGILHGITRENCGHLRMVVPVWYWSWGMVLGTDWGTL